MSDTPKKFKDMRVADLKQELQKRGLQTSGVKAVLADRLKNAMTEEGIDVEEYNFEKSASKDAENGASDEEQAGGGQDGKSETADNPTAEATAEPAEKTAEAAEEPTEEGDEPAELNEPGEEKEAEDDSLNIMVGDEDNLFGEEDKANGAPKSPPRPENVPAKHPFTSRDTLSLSSRGNRPPSENSSMRVNPDETQSVASHDSNNEMSKAGDETVEEVAGEGTATGDTAGKDAAKSSRNEADKAKTSRPATAPARNLWVTGLSDTTRARDLKELFSKYGKVEGAKVGDKSPFF